MARTDDEFNLRLPDGWRSRIKDRARLNRRSMNSEILAALESVVGTAAAGEVLTANSPAAVASNGVLADATHTQG